MLIIVVKIYKFFQFYVARVSVNKCRKRINFQSKHLHDRPAQKQFKENAKVSVPSQKADEDNY